MSKKNKKNQSSSPSASPVRGARAAVLTENAEPTAERRPIPIAFIILTLVLLYYADLYVLDRGGDVMNKAGAFPAQVYDPYYTIADVEKANPVDPITAVRNEGAKVFNTACVACHQANGQGLAGQFPPLAGSEWVLAEGPNRIIRIVLHGVAGPLNVKGADFNNAMPPWKESFTDAQIAAVITYIRSEWGNKAGPVTAEQVKKWRDKDGSRGEPMNAGELQNTPEKD
jgi:mono/diheme cytochrome c family protein